MAPAMPAPITTTLQFFVTYIGSLVSESIGGDSRIRTATMQGNQRKERIYGHATILAIQVRTVRLLI